MNTEIDAIFLDIGNTLRFLSKEESHRAQARERIASLIGTPNSPDAFCAELDYRYTHYRNWAFENLAETTEIELWSRWLTPEIPLEQLNPIAHELTYQFRQSTGRRVMVEDGKKVVVELYNRGYLMGIISNVITTEEIPEWLEAEGLSQYFCSVVLSSTFGRRKPHPSLFLEAARKAGVEPQKCVYIGDNYSRDVTGARAAGFGMVVIMPDPAEKDTPIPREFEPDLTINSLNDLLKYFPKKGKFSSLT